MTEAKGRKNVEKEYQSTVSNVAKHRTSTEKSCWIQQSELRMM
jgi:hypothetical protein